MEMQIQLQEKIALSEKRQADAAEAQLEIAEALIESIRIIQGEESFEDANPPRKQP